jgi:toxin ParE1/3/4
MLAVVRSRKAEQDLISHWRYVGQFDEAAADALLETIEERCSRLAHFPNLGLLRSDIRQDMRCLVVGEYLVLYKVDENEVLIVRIAHGKRDVGGLFPL